MLGQYDLLNNQLEEVMGKALEILERIPGTTQMLSVIFHPDQHPQHEILWQQIIYQQSAQQAKTGKSASCLDRSYPGFD